VYKLYTKLAALEISKVDLKTLQEAELGNHLLIQNLYISSITRIPELTGMHSCLDSSYIFSWKARNYVASYA
jgi:hypothetical protein